MKRRQTAKGKRTIRKIVIHADERLPRSMLDYDINYKRSSTHCKKLGGVSISFSKPGLLNIGSVPCDNILFMAQMDVLS